MAASKNGTFLFDRNYMDYHSDRFDDHSLMVFLNRRLFALLPGNRCGDTFISHQGLTYGGFVIDGRATAVTVGEAFACINDYLRSEGFRKVVYKPVPHIYHRYPADEDLYALFVTCRARLVERDASSTLLLSRRPKFAESRLSGVRKARRYGVTVGESTDVEVFWHILTASLHDRYGAKPVHTVDEMRLLKERFPEQIRLYMAFLDDKPVGGTVLYLTPTVAHTQYISASEEGRQTGALDLLFHHLLIEADLPQPWFDFGTSAVGDTCLLNTQLIFQKLGFGARCVCYDRYEYDV